MITLRDVPAERAIEKLKEELKKIECVKCPDSLRFVKTGVNVERPPQQEDFWYIRSAAILRKLYLYGRPVGVQRLRVAFGGKRRRGHKPAHFRKAGGKIIRLMLQQLEEAGLVKKDDKRRGRVLTAQGQKFLDGITKGMGS